MKRPEEPNVPPRPRLTKSQRRKAFEDAKGICSRCRLPVDVPKQRFIVEHLRARELLGSDGPENLGITHEHCAKEKTRDEARIIAKAHRVRDRHLGIKPNSGRKMPFGRDSGLKKKIGGEVVERRKPWSPSRR